MRYLLDIIKGILIGIIGVFVLLLPLMLELGVFALMVYVVVLVLKGTGVL